MRTFAPTLSALALAAATAVVPVAAASAAKPPAPKATAATWAKKNHLKGSWRAKDADRDGLANLREFKLGTNPRKADSDRDGLRDADEIRVGDDPLKSDSDGDKVKDGAEHAGVVTAYDGETVTIRQFKGGSLTASIAGDADCYAADDDTGADDQSDDGGYVGDDSASSDDTGDDDLGADAATVDDGTDEVDLGAGATTSGDDASTCDDASLEKGAVLRSVELENDGGDLLITAVELVS
jgi:hypothetical protein